MIFNTARLRTLWNASIPLGSVHATYIPWTHTYTALPTACVARHYDHFHSYAVAKPLTDIAHHSPQKKTLTLINGSLADINVENRAKRKYPREKSPTLTKERNLFSNAHIYLIQLLDFTVHHRAPPLSKTGNNISISTLQILLKVVTFAQASK